MSVNQYRLLGCAFAAADLLIEIGPDGQILFAVGAAGRLGKAGTGDLVGSSWRDLVAAEDHPLVESILINLTNGARRGPVGIEVVAEGGARRPVTFYACMLPELAPSVSCAISAATAQSFVGGQVHTGPEKLHDAKSLGTLAQGMLEVSRATGLDVDMCLVEVKGLKSVLDQQPDAGEKALRSIAGALRANSYGGAGAARLEAERFAVLREQGTPVETLIDQVNAAAGRVLGPDAPIKVGAQSIAFDAKTVEPEQAIRALRFALNQFIGDGLLKNPGASLGAVFQNLVEDTMNNAGAFKAIVEARKFSLAFQPVVALGDGSIHHHEVLARFAEGESPFALIRLAEELDLIERFDMVMVEAVIERIARKDGVGLLAVNISGRSIMSPAFIEGLTRLLKSARGCAGKLLFEVTESAALTDLALADRHIQALRKAGFPVCLDDFGAGAASYPYLRMLTVDAVKIDGQYIRELGRSARDADLVKHLVGLCRSLNVKTTAEMVENEKALNELKRLGVDYGQGWIFGKPGASPLPPADKVAVGAKAPASNRVRA